MQTIDAGAFSDASTETVNEPSGLLATDGIPITGADMSDVETEEKDIAPASAIAWYSATAYSAETGSERKRSSSIQPHQFDSFPTALFPKDSARSLSEQAALSVRGVCGTPFT